MLENKNKYDKLFKNVSPASMSGIHIFGIHDNYFKPQKYLEEYYFLQFLEFFQTLVKQSFRFCQCYFLGFVRFLFMIWIILIYLMLRK